MFTTGVATDVDALEYTAELPGPGPTFHIDVLGPLSIRRGTTQLRANDLGGPKPRQVLEILLLNFGSAVSKARLVELLWNGKHPAVALPTLESYVSVLRRHLQPGASRTGPLRTVTGGYLIDSSMVDLDLDRFERLTQQARRAAPPTALALLTQALEIASAPLLGDELTPAWAEEERALHAGRVCLARLLAAECALAAGDRGKAIMWGSEAVQEDPLNERAWTALVLGLEQNSERTEALRVFERCRRIMADELGCVPGPLLKQAQARLLATTAGTARSTGPATAPVRPAPSSGPEPASVAEEELRILVVDDHLTFSDLLTGALDREPGFRSVGAAADTDSAVAMFKELGPDVVVMDLYLAAGSGLNAAERILTEAPGTRIVMLTGNPSQEALAEAARMGICGFLPKDGGLSTMLTTLRQARPGTMVVHPSLMTRIGGTPPRATGSAGT